MTYENRETFKKNLNHLISEKNMTQRDVAKGIGVKDSTVSQWCLGVSCPRGDMLLRLSDFMCVSPSSLLGIEGTMQVMEEEQILHDFRMLSPIGKQEALKRMSELKQLYWYNKEEVAKVI